LTTYLEQIGEGISLEGISVGGLDVARVKETEKDVEVNMWGVSDGVVRNVQIIMTMINQFIRILISTKAVGTS
jgi:hypothetical protein